MINTDTIVALATPQGVGAIGVIRLSGPQAIAIVSAVFRGKDLTVQKSHTIHYGHIMDGEKVVDEVMVSIFRSPKSFTTEDVVEISCHGSPFVAGQIIALMATLGARPAKPGEFTLRAFMNGRIDLSQAEAVADLIASDSAAAQDIALKQMRGGFSNQLKELRGQLVNFASLIELELDFGEEDVEFANRGQLLSLINNIQAILQPLIESFRLGNVIKNGVNTVIAGKPNAGKSTLLNALLNEERAIVSEIPGTTRDTIEEVMNINGLQFRFIDTAGIRSSTDVIEQMGVAKTMEKLKLSSVYIYLFDVNSTSPEELVKDLHELELTGFSGLIVGNKIDKANWKVTAPFYKIFEADARSKSQEPRTKNQEPGAKSQEVGLETNISSLATNNRQQATERTTELLFISASTHYNLPLLKDKLYQLATGNKQLTTNTIITNARHHEALNKANAALDEVKAGIENANTGDLTALDIKRALNYLGEITGEVTNDEILGNIFGKFCIGK